MGIRADIQSLSPSALIELFELDMSVTTSGGKLYFHAGTNGLSQPIVWQGVSYEPWPIKASGFDKSGQGTLPRPKIQVSNYDGVISAELQANDDLIGCKIIRKMTLARFLDAVNFPDGNPTADPSQHFADEMWFVEQKTLETHQYVGIRAVQRLRSDGCSTAVSSDHQKQLPVEISRNRVWLHRPIFRQKQPANLFGRRRLLHQALRRL